MKRVMQVFSILALESLCCGGLVADTSDEIYKRDEEIAIMVDNAITSDLDGQPEVQFNVAPLIPIEPESRGNNSNRRTDENLSDREGINRVIEAGK